MRARLVLALVLALLLTLPMICTALVAGVAHAGAYQAARILAPEFDATVHDNNGNLTVAIDISPAIAVDSGDYFLLLLDGMEVARGTEQNIALKNIDRGSHTLQIEVRAKDGALLMTSKLVSFYMWRASALFPAPENRPQN